LPYFFYISKICIDMSSMNVSWLLSFTSFIPKPRVGWTIPLRVSDTFSSTVFPSHWFPKTFWTKMRWLRCEKKRVVLKYFLRSLEGVWVWYSEPKLMFPQNPVFYCMIFRLKLAKPYNFYRPPFYLDKMVGLVPPSHY
jgi:hypothetical protein